MEPFKKHSLFILILTFIAGLFSPTTIEAAEITESEKAAVNLSEKQKTFIDERIEWAMDLGDEIEAEYGGKPPITSSIAQSAYETGWGQSKVCQNYNNDFGIGGTKPKGFSSHYESWAYYYKLVATRKGYVNNGSLKCDNTYRYIQALVAGGYCPDRGYLSNVLSIAKKIKPYVVAKESEIRAKREKNAEKAERKKAAKEAAKKAKQIQAEADARHMRAVFDAITQSPENARAGAPLVLFAFLQE